MTMHATVLATLLLFPALSAAAGDRLSWHGSGDLRIGMSRRAFHAAGHALATAVPGAPNDPADPRFDWRGCVERPLRGAPQLALMFEDGLLVRISATGPALSTRAGVRVGAREAQIHRAYARTLASSGQKYNERRRNVSLVSRDGRHAFVFALENGRVVEIRAGFAEAVTHDDGCPC